jgi:[NiFe] hydrogenase diaphorase moiety large subunit
VIDDLAGSEGIQRERLLQYLYGLQGRFSHVPPEAIDRLAAELGLPASHIRGVISFYSFLHESPRGDFDILFSDSITDHMLGSRELHRRLCERLGVTSGQPRSDGRVTVDLTSCTGMCDQGPALLVNGLAVTRLDEARIDAIAGLVEAGTALADWPPEFFAVEDNIRRRDLLLNDSGEGGALQVLQQQGAEAMLLSLEQSGLRGRGGAGFPTATKWRLCRESGADAHYVVCNADEGEPGTFKDRILLNSHADRMIEGMTLCAGIIGARQGYIYLRAEYRYLREPLEAVLQRRRDAGLLGSGITGDERFDFDIEIHMGAGAYICGEESSLIESLEGKRGIPRKRPPFPVNSGFRNRPTVVNNVETFMAAALIAEHGADWFRGTGTESSSGTKLLSISGDCERPGIYEYPYGVSIREILEDCGAREAQAVQIAGAAGATVPATEFDRVVTFDDLATGGSFMVFDASRDLLDMVLNFSRFFVHESCGFCTPCRVGGALLRDLVEKVHAGHASDYDLEEMRGIGSLMRTSSHCGLGTTAPNPVLDTLDKCPEIYRRRLTGKGFEPAFDLDAALSDARRIAGRDDETTHIGVES